MTPELTLASELTPEYVYKRLDITGCGEQAWAFIRGRNLEVQGVSVEGDQDADEEEQDADRQGVVKEEKDAYDETYG